MRTLLATTILFLAAAPLAAQVGAGHARFSVESETAHTEALGTARIEADRADRLVIRFSAERPGGIPEVMLKLPGRRSIPESGQLTLERGAPELTIRVPGRGALTVHSGTLRFTDPEALAGVLAVVAADPDGSAPHRLQIIFDAER